MKNIKRVLCLIIIVAMLLSFCACNNTKVADNENDKLQDLNYVCSQLEKNHKNLYANISKEAFIEEKNKIAENVDTMSEAEFYYSLRHLISVIGDAHTRVYYNDEQSSLLNLIPFAVNKFDNDWRLSALGEENKEFLGYKLLAINNIDINDIYQMSKSIMSFDNEAWAQTQLGNIINYKEALEYLGVIKDNEFVELKIVADDGVEQILKLMPAPYKEVQSAKLVYLEPKQIPATAQNGYYRCQPIDDNNFFIQYNVCAEASDLTIKKFVEIINDCINQDDYKNIIIDLRYNSGGNSLVINPLIETLKSYKDENDIKIFTLIGSNTFSSSLLNAIDCKNILGSTLIGTPTGGSVNHFGEVKEFSLKNYPISISYSIKYFERLKEYEGGSLMPDIEIGQTYEDYMQGIDTAIEWIVKNN